MNLRSMIAIGKSEISKQSVRMPNQNSHSVWEFFCCKRKTTRNCRNVLLLRENTSRSCHFFHVLPVPGVQSKTKRKKQHDMSGLGRGAYITQPDPSLSRFFYCVLITLRFTNWATETGQATWHSSFHSLGYSSVRREVQLIYRISFTFCGVILLTRTEEDRDRQGKILNVLCTFSHATFICTGPVRESAMSLIRIILRTLMK